MALHQLRLAVGDRAFFRILPAWAAQHRYGTAGRPELTTATARSAAAAAQPKSWAKVRAAHELLTH